MPQLVRIGSLAATMALGGCNQVFDIDTTDVVMNIDSDGDGQSDLEDNCPMIENADQVDFDGDNVGDTCDNCPLNANTQQQNAGEVDGDRDDVGDDCDPNPTIAGDCLVLIDQFSDPARLAEDWELVYGVDDPAPTLEHTGDHVVFQPHGANTPAFMVARVDGVRRVGRFSVNVVGQLPPVISFAEAMAAADIVSPESYVACGVQKINSDVAATYIRFQVSATTSQIQVVS